MSDKEVGPNVIQPLFVSLDPWRDSVEQMKAYAKRKMIYACA